jgi:hypothetical protein
VNGSDQRKNRINRRRGENRATFTYNFGHDLTRKREQALSEVLLVIGSEARLGAIGTRIELKRNESGTKEKLGSADKTIRLWPN